MTRKPYPSRAPEAVAARREAVAILTRAGLSRIEIAAMLDLTPGRVGKYREALNLTKHPHRLSPQEVEFVRELLSDGVSITEAARTLNVAKSALLSRFPGAGWDRRQTADHIRALRKYEPDYAARTDPMPSSFGYRTRKAPSPEESR